MDKKQLNPPSLFLSSKPTGHTGLIPPSHFETRRRMPLPPSPVPVPPTPTFTEPWADLARELDQLRKENEELKKKQTRGEGIRARSLERQPSAVPHSESQALEIIAHQMREIRSLELAVADVQEKEEVVQRLTGELQELRRTQRECQLTEEKKRRAEESAVRQQQEELMMRSESYKMESETLRKRAQLLEVELREEREQRTQEVARLREDLQAANQEGETLKEQLSKSLLELDSQHSLVQQLRTYIGELVPDNRRLEEQKKEKLELQNTIQALERERETLQTSISLLNTRLSSLTNILSLQEGELCKKHSVFLVMSFSAWHILTWQGSPTLLCKNPLYLSDCEGISCAQLSSDHPTDFRSDSGLGSDWAITKL
ncbi:coiled-coil alpha-helical rod protein 1-like [Bombina bombina]|uniref:coiled-coil alpha-helical rod protein 1-like n=1 Tax=Bombina bombina TaxID=8345 RepID=UPI00235AED66|nr:coiled-coil alpha-helical rod protein 1-like [Bombina bombina]